MRIGRTEKFKKAWQQLTGDQKELARKAVDLLVKDMHYPALRVKKIKGAEYIWEARVSRSIRITFELQKDLIILRNIGQHDETLERP